MTPVGEDFASPEKPSSWRRLEAYPTSYSAVARRQEKVDFAP
jgi:hypothetical protein